MYEKVKKETYETYPKHSAYRSGLLVKRYKELGGKYKGKESSKFGLNRWFKEKWENQRGMTGYKYESDVYRPTVKVNEKKAAIFLMN